ncbi:MAG: GHKL domain-containing protein [Bacilli bacterium]|nr:GHKL domain-containing protein [Bacilli bacterium]MDD4406561.1 GHKL domain-containing protein [Bacilli bacterium]
MNNLYGIPFFLTSILTAVVLVFCYRYFSENNKKIGIIQWLIIIIISFFIMQNNLREDMFLKSIIILLLNLLLYYAIFRESLFKTIYLGLYISILSIFTDLLFFVLIINIVPDINFFNTHMQLDKIIFSIIVGLSFYFMCRIPFLKRIAIILLLLTENKKNNIFILYLIFAIIASLYSVYISGHINYFIYILIILIIIFILITSSLYFKEKYKNSLLRMKNKNLIENQILFKRSMEDYRVLRHNLLNDLILIKSICSAETQEIINEKISKYNVMPKIMCNLNTIPEGLQGIIYLKSNIAKNSGIHFYIDNFSKYNYKNLSSKIYVDLCEIISISIDNAIEASINTEDKVIYLNLLEENDYLYIEIFNTFSNDISIDEIGNLNYSTKKRNSGLGLYYIISLNKKIKIKKEIRDNLFKISIIIKKG